MDSSQSNQETRQLSRDYKCPCGKTYLSNAAIFTHIKQKHGGVVSSPLCRLLGPLRSPNSRANPEGDHHSRWRTRTPPARRTWRGANRMQLMSTTGTVPTTMPTSKSSASWGKSIRGRTSAPTSGRRSRPSNSSRISSNANSGHWVSSTRESALGWASPSSSSKCPKGWNVHLGALNRSSSCSSCWSSTQSMRTTKSHWSRRPPWNY